MKAGKKVSAPWQQYSYTKINAFFNNRIPILLILEHNQHKTELQNDAAVVEDSGCTLVLWNDDYHTFDYVIKALVDICRHSFEEAQQCTIIVHTHGKCAVKHGSYEDLLPMHTALLDKQLTSEIVR